MAGRQRLLMEPPALGYLSARTSRIALSRLQSILKIGQHAKKQKTKFFLVCKLGRRGIGVDVQFHYRLKSDSADAADSIRTASAPRVSWGWAERRKRTETVGRVAELLLHPARYPTSPHPSSQSGQGTRAGTCSCSTDPQKFDDLRSGIKENFSPSIQGSSGVKTAAYVSWWSRRRPPPRHC